MTFSNRKSLSWSPSVSIAIKNSLSCVSSLAHFIDLAGRWCSWQRMLVLHLCNRLRSPKTPPYANHLEQSLLCCEVWVRFIRSPSRIYRIVFEPYPRRYPFFVKATALDWCPKSALRGHRAWSCASRRFRKPGRLKCGTFLNTVYTHLILLMNVLF